MRTEETRKADGYGGLIIAPETTWSVARLKRDLGNGSTVGIIGLSKDTPGFHNRVFGGDWDITLNKYLRTGGYLAKSSTPGLAAATSRAPPTSTGTAGSKAFLRCAMPTSSACSKSRAICAERGFSLVATGGTHSFLSEHGIACERINKVLEGRPHIVDLDQERRDRLHRQHHRRQAGDRRLVLDPPRGAAAARDLFDDRQRARRALLHSLDFRDSGEVHSLQELHGNWSM